jgi:site-specific DNA-methyltransferase (adenine-specific)
MVELLHCDCMDYMKGLKDNAFELAVVDPPYGIGGDSIHANRLGTGAGKLKNRALQKYSTAWDIAPTKDYFNELFRISNEQIIFGGNYFALPRNRGFIIWDKCQPWPNFSAVEYIWQSHDVPSKIFKFDNRTSGKIHPTQKPVKLYEWLLKNYAKEGDRILDTHLGSASSAIAAYNYNYNFVGIELDADYFKAASKRFEQHKQQLTIF